jgi:hypothetical protein
VTSYTRPSEGRRERGNSVRPLAGRKHGPSTTMGDRMRRRSAAEGAVHERVCCRSVARSARLRGNRGMWGARADPCTGAGGPTRRGSGPESPGCSDDDLRRVQGLIEGRQRTTGTAIPWLDGYYSGRSGLSELPAGWLRTVSQGIGGICAISVNEHRTVLDVIGQLYREYAGRN